MNNWKKVCDKVSTIKNLLEMEFEKGVASYILSCMGWNDFQENIKEQYHIEDHAKGYYPDFALFPEKTGQPGIFVELKKPGHKQRTKDVKQIRTYMMLTNCRYCLYFGEKMELFFIKINGTHRDLQSVITLDYNPNHPDGNLLLDLLKFETFNEKRLLDFCEDRLAADETVEFYTSPEGHQRLYELIAQDRKLSQGAASLLPSMLTTPERKARGVETITEEESGNSNTFVTTIPASGGDILDDFRTFSEKSVGKNTTKNYIRHLNKDVRAFIATLIDKNADSVFSFKSSLELRDCIATLKASSDFVATNKAKRYFLTASLSKYLEFLEQKEGIEHASKPQEKPQKEKKDKKQRKKSRPPFKFSMIGLKIGDEVIFESRGLTVKVASDNTVEYHGEQMKMSTFCKKYLPDDLRNKSEAYQGPDYFTYHGKSLADIRDEREGFKKGKVR